MTGVSACSQQNDKKLVNSLNELLKDIERIPFFLASMISEISG
ncbi:MULTISPECIES: type II toxin-antitoxin system YoeB family toxin [Photorhabdus]|nr:MULTISPECIES: type II toxin-antitoxin system YoeB family toxin [Photorhabdus]MDB6369672.1 hypothetical protein [Photorhabdus bodei]